MAWKQHDLHAWIGSRGMDSDAPAFAAPATPWLGQMRPFTMKSASDQLPDPPRALTSEPWSRDYNLTRNYGGATSAVRSAAETEIGIFWTEQPVNNMPAYSIT